MAFLVPAAEELMGWLLGDAAAAIGENTAASFAEDTLAEGAAAGLGEDIGVAEAQSAVGVPESELLDTTAADYDGLTEQSEIMDQQPLAEEKVSPPIVASSGEDLLEYYPDSTGIEGTTPAGVSQYGSYAEMTGLDGTTRAGVFQYSGNYADMSNMEYFQTVGMTEEDLAAQEGNYIRDMDNIAEEKYIENSVPQFEMVAQNPIEQIGQRAATRAGIIGRTMYESPIGNLAGNLSGAIRYAGSAIGSGIKTGAAIGGASLVGYGLVNNITPITKSIQDIRNYNRMDYKENIPEAVKEDPVYHRALYNATNWQSTIPGYTEKSTYDMHDHDENKTYQVNNTELERLTYMRPLQDGANAFALPSEEHQLVAYNTTQIQPNLYEDYHLGTRRKKPMTSTYVTSKYPSLNVNIGGVSQATRSVFDL